MIRIEHAKKYFNRHKSNEVRAIDDTTLTLGDQGLVAFLGHSGCGKTTLLNAIGGLDNLSSGKIYIDDEKISTHWSFKKDDIRNRNIGYIFQYYNLIDNATVFDNVAVVLKMMGIRDKKTIEERVMYVLEKIGMDRYRHRPAKMLSGGERQRVGIARAIVKNPKIIIADEPTGNLDSENTIQVMNIIKAISRDRLVILVTHEKEIAHFYADRIVEIVDGKVDKDYENTDKGNLDLRIDNRIYLKDMPEQKSFEDGNVKIDYYGDGKLPVNVKVVVKNNAIYISTEGAIKKGGSGVKLIDDHYQEITKDVYEKYNFDYDKMVDKDFKPRYASIYSWRQTIAEGFRRVFGFSKLRKFLLVGFALSSMFVLYSISSMVGISTIYDKEFMNSGRNYIEVSYSDGGIELYNQLVSLPETQSVVLGDSKVDMTIDASGYVETNSQGFNMKASLIDRQIVKAEDVIEGRYPENNKEVLIDKMVIDKMDNDFQNGKSVGLMTYKDYVGRTARPISGQERYTIVGITDTKNPAIYADESQLVNISTKGKSKNSEGIGEPTTVDMVEQSSDGSTKFTSMTTATANPYYSLKKGRNPENDEEVLIPEEKELEGLYIGSKTKDKYNGKQLKVVGVYRYNVLGQEMGYVVTDEAYKENAIKKGKSFAVWAKTDKAELMSEIGQLGYNGVDLYEKERDGYVDSMSSVRTATTTVALVMLIISLIELYLMLRSSFLSKVKEVGVLRAIGLKQLDVSKMFIGEIIAITVVTSIPGLALMYGFITKLMELPKIGSMYELNGSIVIAAFLVLLFFNLTVGLIPVVSTMRKTPAAILSRTDAD